MCWGGNPTENLPPGIAGMAVQQAVTRFFPSPVSFLLFPHTFQANLRLQDLQTGVRLKLSGGLE